jgi:hypothetical protein
MDSTGPRLTSEIWPGLAQGGFRGRDEIREGESRLDREMIPAFESGDARGLHQSPYVEAFK